MNNAGDHIDETNVDDNGDIVDDPTVLAHVELA
jgi:hypothetical protein